MDAASAAGLFLLILLGVPAAIFAVIYLTANTAYKGYLRGKADRDLERDMRDAAKYADDERRIARKLLAERERGRR